MTTTGRLGMCSRPSSNIGRDVAAASDAGIIISHSLFGMKSSWREHQLENLDPGELVDSIETRKSILYVIKVTMKKRNAIVSAVFG
jgi:hypothetical protein